MGIRKEQWLCCETAPETWILSLVHVAHCKDSGKRQKDRRGGWRATRDYGLKGRVREPLCTGNRGFRVCISTTTQPRQLFLGLGWLVCYSSSRHCGVHLLFLTPRSAGDTHQGRAVHVLGAAPMFLRWRVFPFRIRVELGEGN